MQINPFNLPLAEKETTYKASLDRTTALTEQLRWYSNFRAEECHRQLMTLDRMLAASQPRRDTLTTQLRQLRAEKVDVDELAQVRLDPRSWISSERSVARRKSIQLASRIAELAHQLATLDALKTDDGLDVVATAARLRAELEMYRRFDVLEARSEVVIRQQEQRVLEGELADLRARKLALDSALAGPCQAHDACQARIRKLQRDIERAEAFDAALGRADGAGRRAIHDRCERELGDGSPRRVIQQAKRQLEPLRRDVAKHDKRIKEAVRNAQLDVREVIIDGSNLAYHGEEFIGLRALEALVPILSERCMVTINFDPGFAQQLRMHHRDIRARLPRASVHFIPPNMSADPFLLDFVEGKRHAYVISNDRFRDYQDKEAVHQNRILGYAVLNDRVSIPALGVVGRFA